MNRYLVAQLGPRRSYSVAGVLESADMLEALYTDICSDLNPGRLLCRYSGIFELESLKRLRGRQIPLNVLSKTRSFALPALRYELTRRFVGSNPYRQGRALSRFSNDVGKSMVKAGFGKATHLYTMLGDVTPLLEVASCQGITTVTEIYIILSAEKIVAAERRKYPGLESDPPKEILEEAFVWLTKVLALSEWFVVPSEAVRDDLIDNYGVAAQRCLLVPYAVGSDWFEIENNPISGRVLFVGSAGLRKGIHTLGEAALELSSSDYSFHVAGDVTDTVRENPITKKLKFLGRVPRVDIAREYEEADILVLPSLAEGSAEVTYEALASGIPVITTHQAGSIVRDGIDGFIVPASNPQVLAQRIRQTVEDRGVRDRMAKKARARAREYTWEKYGHRLAEALRCVPSNQY